jgi:hypothetical protein
MSYIYVMQSDNMPGLVKIGMTDLTPQVHAEELNKVTGALASFTVAHQWQLKDAAIYEKRIAGVLSCYRISGEHFRLPVAGALHRITNMLHSWDVVNDEGLTKEDAEAMRQAAVLRDEQTRVEDERQRGIDAEMAIVKAAHQSQGSQPIRLLSNAIVWCMTWALIELYVHVQLIEHRHPPGWQYLAHIAGLIGLGIVLKMSATKRLTKCSDTVPSMHGLPIRWAPSR